MDFFLILFPYTDLHSPYYQLQMAEDAEAPPASGGFYLSGNSPQEDVAEPSNKAAEVDAPPASFGFYSGGNKVRRSQGSGKSSSISSGGCRGGGFSR